MHWPSVIAMFKWPLAVLLSLCAAVVPAGEAEREPPLPRVDKASETKRQDALPPGVLSFVEKPAPTTQQRPAAISLQDATAIVRQAYGGRVVSATEAKAPGKPSAGKGERASGADDERGYRVRVDVDGRVKTVFVDRRGRIRKPGR